MNASSTGDISLCVMLISASVFVLSRSVDALTFSDSKVAVVSAHKATKTRVKVTSIDQLPTIQATLDRHVDGDTSHFIVDGKSKSTRYTGIDTAELHYFGKAQKGGKEAREYLESLINSGKTYTLKISGNAAHDRLSAIIFDGEKNINEEMVRAGWAWPCPDYLKKFPSYADNLNMLWEKAKKEKRGVWSLEKNPTPPWVWRDEQDRLHKRGKYKHAA